MHPTGLLIGSPGPRLDKVRAALSQENGAVLLQPDYEVRALAVKGRAQGWVTKRRASKVSRIICMFPSVSDGHSIHLADLLLEGVAEITKCLEGCQIEFRVDFLYSEHRAAMEALHASIIMPCPTT